MDVLGLGWACHSAAAGAAASARRVTDAACTHDHDCRDHCMGRAMQHPMHPMPCMAMQQQGSKATQDKKEGRNNRGHKHYCCLHAKDEEEGGVVWYEQCAGVPDLRIWHTFSHSQPDVWQYSSPKQTTWHNTHSLQALTSSTSLPTPLNPFAGERNQHTRTRRRSSAAAVLTCRWDG